MASIPPGLAKQPKITLHWLDNSRSQRILWLLEELDLSYDIDIHHRNPKTRLAPPELKKIHPLGKAPVITILPAGTTEPIVLAESGLITEYLIDHFGSDTTLLPEQWKENQEGKIGGETQEWLRYRYYMHYAEGSLMPLMVISLIASMIKKSHVPFFIKPITSAISRKIFSGFLGPNFETNFSFLEQQLKTSPKGGDYLCGPNLTGADILMSFPLIAAKDSKGQGIKEGKYPLLSRYIERLEQEPGYKKAVQKIVDIDG